MENPSYVHGHSGAPLIGKTIGSVLRGAAAAHPDRDALIVCHQNIRWSYADLDREADWFAAGLLELGLGPGDRLGIWSPNCAEWTVAQYASARIGVILVSINPAYRVSELEHALRASGCKALVTAMRFKSSDYLDMLAQLIPTPDRSGRPIASEKLPDLHHVIVIGTEGNPGYWRFEEIRHLGTAALEDDAKRQHFAQIAEETQFDEAINIQFTSGTTGLPKGATLSHHNLLNNGFCVGEATGILPGDRLCVPVPLYHCFGMVMANLGCLTRGATMVYPSDAFDAEQTMRAIEAERCTLLYGVPTMYIAMLGHPEFSRFDLNSLRGGIMAGAPCPVEIMNAVIAKMHMREITIAYGMTETSPVSFQTRRDDPVELRVSTVGTIMPHLEVKIIDEAGRIVPRGVAGELCTRGYSVMIGYWGDEERTRGVLDSAGWMHTGDLATIDEAGYCRIVGRIKDMVIRGGENLYPREIEEYLYRHSAIRDVQVFGVPDEKYGEELCAWIILEDGAEVDEDAVRAFCRGQIAHHKIPRYIRFVLSFPTTVTGKIQKFLMREAMIAELAREPVP